MRRSFYAAGSAAMAMLSALSVTTIARADWQPNRPVEFIVPAGTGGGADQMARVVQGIITKHNLMPTSMVVVNKSGGAGGEGFLDVKNSSGNPHKIVITLSNLFTTPMATGIPFNWKDLTPVAMLALDEFILWVNAEKPYKTAKEFVDAAKAANGAFKMSGTGSKQEDQIITEAIQKVSGAKLIYIPQRGGGAVAVQLVGNHVDSTVNNPIEAVSHWRAGKLRPLCIFDSKPVAYSEVIAEGKAWKDVPTCKSQGLDVEYLMLRGIFMPGGVTKEQVDYYVNLFRKVRDTPEWKKLMEEGAFNTTFMIGDDYAKWVAKEEAKHHELMKAAGFLGTGAN
jgi:putative tricarboxylic transport membrane protein